MSTVFCRMMSSIKELSGAAGSSTRTEGEARNSLGAARLFASIALFSLVFSGFSPGIAQVAIQTSVSYDQNSPSSTISSPVFSTATANELLLAFIATDAAGGTNTVVQGVSGAGLTWALVERTNAEAGTTEIWRAFAPAALRNVRVTATLSQTVVSSITVSGFAGAATSGTYGSGAIGAVGSGYARSGAPSAKLVTTQNGSLVVGVGNDYDNAIARTPLSGQAVIHQDLSSTQDTYWVQRVNSLISAKGTTVTLGDASPTSDRYNLSICEIVPGVSTVAASASSLNFGSVTDGTTSKLALTFKSTGTNPVTISSDAISGTGFSIASGQLPATLSPGQTLTLGIAFAPTAIGTFSGQLAIKSNSSSGSTTLVSLTGGGVSTTSGPKLSLSTTSLSFGKVPDGTSEVLNLTLSSTGGSSLVVSSASVSGTGFSVVAGSWPQTLPVGHSLTLEIKFAPTAIASETGRVTIASNSATGASVAVTLTGIGKANPKLAISPSSLSFGTVSLGSSKTLSVTLASTGTTPVTVSAGAVSGGGFSLAGGTFPISLSPGATASLSIKFAPTISGIASGSLLVTGTSITGNTATVVLSGTGVATVTHSVTLTWNAPANSPEPVAGYHIYRTVSGSTAFYLLNSSLDTKTSYVDGTVANGATYIYEVKSVGTDAVESTASNQIAVSVPQ